MVDAVDAIERLTVLVGAHGVYAMVVIFIFYLERRAYNNLKAATKAPERKYFRRVHLTVVAATLVLTAVAIPTWWYANFSFEPPVVGTLSDVTEQRREPTKQDDPPSDLEQLGVEGLDVPFFVQEKETVPGSGSYQIGWTIPRIKADHVRFAFVHTRGVFEHQPLAEPTLDPSTSGKVQRVTQTGKFMLPLTGFGSRNSAIEFTYKRHPTALHDSLGKIFVRRGNDLVELPWESLSAQGTSPSAERHEPASPAPGAPAAGARDSAARMPPAAGVEKRDSGRDFFAFLSVARAFAQSASQRPIFAADGSYDPRAGASLRSQLGGRDVATQLSARNALVSARKRSIRFIQESMDESAARAVDDRSALLRNLAVALADIERYEQTSFPDLTHRLALALYRNGSYQTAGSLFATLSDSAMNPEDWYYRGYAHYSSGQYGQAIASLNSYLRLTRDATAQSAAHTLMALCYESQHQSESAVTNYKRALDLVPTNSQAANNLAYLYAVQNQQLPTALQLANQALSREPTNPHFLDTKAWVLYRQGKYDEALRLVEQAAKDEPYNDEILQHRDVLRKARSGTREARGAP